MSDTAMLSASQLTGTDQVDANPLVSVLIVTWNRKDDVLEAVRSVYRQRYRNVQVVVVDNGSSDGTVEATRQAFPNAKIVALEKNLGVSAGRNAGIAVADGDIIFCLDSDASLSEDGLQNLVRRFIIGPDVGVINSKIVNATSGKIDGGPGWAYSERQKANQDKEFLSWSFSEGGGAIRKDVFKKVGLFWETLFFGCEGQEFSMRVWDAGYKVLYFPKSVVYHRASALQRVGGRDREQTFLRNTLYIYIVRYPIWMLVLLAPLKIGAVLLRGASRGYLLDVIGALLQVLKATPALMRQRKPISTRTAKIYLKLQREQGPLSWSLSSWLRHKI